MTAAAIPRPGDVVYVGQAASVQFAGLNGIRFRVIRVHDWPTYDGVGLDRRLSNQRSRGCGRAPIDLRSSCRSTPCDGGPAGYAVSSLPLKVELYPNARAVAGGVMIVCRRRPV
jgi:hypothetical protein